MRYTLQTTYATTLDFSVTDSMSVVIYFHSGKTVFYRFETALLDKNGEYCGGRLHAFLPDAMTHADELLATRRDKLIANAA